MFGVRVLAIASCWVCITSNASAQVYRCVDPAGKQAFSDVPCAPTARSGDQVLGTSATQRRSPEEENAAAERNLQSIERARALQQDTVDASVRQSQVHVSAQAAQPTPAGIAPALAAAPSDQAETFSTRRGGIGGSREANPNWSARRGYYGGGGPADEKYEREQADLRRLKALQGREPPGRTINCDTTGCWGASNSVRHDFVAGGHLQGSNGSFCTKAGQRFNCN